MYLEISVGKCPTTESDKRPTVKETGNPQESTPQCHSPNAAVCGYLPQQEATCLGTEEYNEVVLSVGNIVESVEITTITPRKCVQKSVNMPVKTEI